MLTEKLSELRRAVICTDSQSRLAIKALHHPHRRVNNLKHV